MHIAVIKDSKNRAVKIAVYYRHYDNYVIISLSFNDAKRLSRKLNDILREIENSETIGAYYE